MSEGGLSPKGQARRSEIIETALRVLSDRGYKDTSLRAIGRELGIQPAHILHYFSSREALLEAVVTAWDHLPPFAADTNMSALEEWLALVARNMQVPGLVHLYTAFAAEASSATHPSHAFFAERYLHVRLWVENDLRRGAATGIYDLALPAQDLAEVLISLSDGLQLRWLVDPSVDMVRQLRNAIARLTGRMPAQVAVPPPLPPER